MMTRQLARIGEQHSARPAAELDVEPAQATIARGFLDTAPPVHVASANCPA